MIETKRSDKKRNITKVLKRVITNPLDNQRKIAKDIWLWLWTVNRVINELEQIDTKIPEIADICKKDFEIMQLVQGITITRLQNQENESFWDIIRAWAESTKRYTIFKWDLTNKDGWLKSFDFLKTMTLEELTEYKKSLIL